MAAVDAAELAAQQALLLQLLQLSDAVGEASQGPIAPVPGLSPRPWVFGQ